MPIRFLFGLIIFVFLSASCGSPSELTPINTPIPAEITQIPTEAPSTAEIVPDALKDLSSYRMGVSVDWKRDEPIQNEGSSQGVIWEQAVSREDRARLIYRLISPGVEDWYLEVDGQSWACYDAALTTCEFIALPDMPMGQPLLQGIETILAENPGTQYEFLGEETIEGISTQHFAISARPLAEVVHWDEANRDSIDNVSGEVWVVNQPGMPFFVLSANVAWDGFMDGATGSGRMEYSIFDVNTEVDIQPPAE